MTGIITTKEQLTETISELLPEALKRAQKAKPEQLYSIPEAAAKLGKAYTTVKRMIDQKRITATTDGRYISQQAIDDYLNGK